MSTLKIENDGKCKDSSFSTTVDLEDGLSGGWSQLSASAYGACGSEVKENLVQTLTAMRDKLSVMIASVEAELAARTPEEIEKEQAEVKERYRHRYGGGW